jgi:hypothetical protein
MTLDASRGIAGLKGALGYVRAYRDRTFVIKVGGEVLADADALDGVAAQVSLLSSLGIRVVVVHGGGPQASASGTSPGSSPDAGSPTTTPWRSRRWSSPASSTSTSCRRSAGITWPRWG